MNTQQIYFQDQIAALEKLRGSTVVDTSEIFARAAERTKQRHAETLAAFAKSNILES